MPRAKAFSLIEMSVVLLIVGIAAAAACLRMHAPQSQAKLTDLAGQMEAFDRQSRFQARQHDSAMRLTIDLAGGRVSRTDEDGRQMGSDLQLPDGWSISKLVLVGKTVESGIATLAVSRGGLTPSYAMLIEGGGYKQWIVVAGMTGQVTLEIDEKHVQDIFAAAAKSAGGSDAD